jgi:heme/copper-type cytochrome/quinol oxidase subunit 2
MEKNLSEEILEKIKKDRIKPKSKWQFALKDYVVWLVFVISIVFGSLSFSTILHFWEMSDWDAYYRVNDNFLAFIALTMPYFWLVCFLLFIFISYFYLKHTRSGYKYEFIKVVALNLALSLVFGCILYSFGAGRQIDEEFARRSPFYNDLRTRQAYVWLNPERGVIIGKIMDIKSNGDIFELDDPQQIVWTVDASNANYPQGFIIQRGFMIKVFGKKGDNNFFSADEIRPLIREKRGPDPLFLPYPSGN